MYKNIERNKAISWNQPKIKGRRLTVFNVIFGAYAENLNDYAEEFELTRETIIDAVNYCATLECQKDSTGNFCDGCILNSLRNGWKIDKDSLEEIAIDKTKILVSLKDDSMYIGSKEEYQEDAFGRMGWRIAELLKQKYNI